MSVALARSQGRGPPNFSAEGEAQALRGELHELEDQLKREKAKTSELEEQAKAQDWTRDDGTVNPMPFRVRPKEEAYLIR